VNKRRRFKAKRKRAERKAAAWLRLSRSPRYPFGDRLESRLFWLGPDGPFAFNGASGLALSIPPVSDRAFP
jgi:hypothetical protein